MNTFSDLQAIDLDLDLALRVQPMGNPLLKISINHDVVYHGRLTHLLEIRRQLLLLQPFAVTVELLDKDYHSNQETAVVIEQLTIDGFELIPRWNHLSTYDNDHQRSQPTHYLGFVGTWSLLVDRPFYQWHHQAANQGMLLTLDQ
jgi:hypothetical protein